MIRAAIVKRFAPGADSAGFELNVSFEAPAGITVLYGASGSGKTLTLDVIAGFVAPDAGRLLLEDRILFDAETRVNLRPQERSCGYVFQNYALFPHMTLRQNIMFAASGLPRLERHRRVAEMLERFKLTDLAGRHPRELSGGQKQRASIARALIAQPRALLFDEPARGLDASLRADLYAAVLETKKSLRTPMLLVTHDLEEGLALADSMLIYDAGKIVHRAAPLDLLRNPGTAAVARLLGDFNLYEAEAIALDPARRTSRIRMLGQEFNGPHLPGCFKGDRVTLCARPEELRLAFQPGDNRVKATAAMEIRERTQSVRVDFGRNLTVDVPREVWANRPEDFWIEIPSVNLRQISR
ncbi:MAG TPA: ABC transporter ATP-binding protein [Bryobacteraceae bacterium]|nr:ABC transporter ATP-binding protein [Bryobacteraceae bacterium]